MNENELKLSGTIRAYTLKGTLTSQKALIGRITLPTGYENYTGSYEVTPKIESQVVDTKNKTMTSDILIKEIPTYKVSNSSGGTTFIIGGNS